MTAPGSKKAPILQYSIFRWKNGHSAVAAALSSNPIEKFNVPNQNTKAKAAPEPDSIPFPPENSLWRFGVITQTGVDDEKSVRIGQFVR